MALQLVTTTTTGGHKQHQTISTDCTVASGLRSAGWRQGAIEWFPSSGGIFPAVSECAYLLRSTSGARSAYRSELAVVSKSMASSMPGGKAVHIPLAHVGDQLWSLGVVNARQHISGYDALVQRGTVVFEIEYFGASSYSPASFAGIVIDITKRLG